MQSKHKCTTHAVRECSAFTGQMREWYPIKTLHWQAASKAIYKGHYNFCVHPRFLPTHVERNLKRTQKCPCPQSTDLIYLRWVWLINQQAMGKWNFRWRQQFGPIYLCKMLIKHRKIPSSAYSHSGRILGGLFHWMIGTGELQKLQWWFTFTHLE